MYAASVEGGDIAARARVLTQEPGTFDVEAHARRVPLESLRPLIKRDIGGRGELDLGDARQTARNAVHQRAGTGV